MLALNQDALKNLLPGAVRPRREDPSCGLTPMEPACHLARMIYRPEAGADILVFACGFGPGNLDCFKARKHFQERQG